MLKKGLLFFLCFLVIPLTSCSNQSNEEIRKEGVKTNQDFSDDSSSEDKAKKDGIKYKEKKKKSEDVPGKFNIDNVIFDQELEPFFKNYKEGCVVIRYEDTTKGISYHEEVAEEQRSPLSTFKILSTIILLEENVITDLEQVISWDGTIYQNDSWNSDQTLSSAFQNSVVWVYKSLLSRIDNDTLKKYLDRTNYGNKDMSDGEEFWLDSSLKISLKEQIDFIEAVYYNKFNFAQSTIDIVKELMLLKRADRFTIYGKTGSSSDGTNLFVGFIESHEDVFYFAVYVKEEKAGYNVAKETTFRIVESLFLDE